MVRAVAILTLVGLTALSFLAVAEHDGECVPTHSEDVRLAATLPGIPFLQGGEATYYVEDRTAYGQGLWVYEEINGVLGLQRGGIGLTGACFPSEPLPCLLIGEDPITDESCAHGPDVILFSVDPNL